MRRKTDTSKRLGQSLVELALLLPILVLLFIGMVEVVFISRSYLALLEIHPRVHTLDHKALLCIIIVRSIHWSLRIYPREGYDASSLIDVIITPADLAGGNVI